MTFFTTGYGLIFSFYIFTATIGLWVARIRFEARNNEDDLYNDVGFPLMSQRDYRLEQIKYVTLFPLGLMSFVHILSVSIDRAPGTIPLVTDLFARGFISLGTPFIAVFSIMRFIKLAKNKNESRKLLFIKFLILLNLLIVTAFYPWTPGNSEWWKIEVMSFGIVTVISIIIRSYELFNLH